MGTTMQRNVCNRGIVRRFGHSQNVAYVHGWKKAKSEFVDSFILKGNVCMIRLCTRSSVKVDS